jgi:hypothetical protein
MRQVSTIGLVRNAVKGNPQTGTAPQRHEENKGLREKLASGLRPHRILGRNYSGLRSWKLRFVVSNNRYRYGMARGRPKKPTFPPAFVCFVSLWCNFLNRDGRTDLAHHPEIGRDNLYDPIQHGGECRQVRVT